MASFTEQAILKVVDKSSPQIRKINAELKKLFATARSLKSVNIRIGVNAAGVAKATAELRRLNTEVNKLKAATHAVRLNVNASGISAATAQLARLRAQAARPIIIRTQQAGGGGGAGAPPLRPRGAVPRAYSNTRTPQQAALGGFAGGLGMGLGRLNESFGTLAAAAFLAAKALRGIVGETYKAERAKLAVQALTSPGQRAIFDQLDKDKGAPPGMLKQRKWQFDFARASFAGDVGNSQDLLDAAVKENRKILSQPEAAAERARRADVLARELFENIMPGLYARDPEMSAEEALEGQRKFVQAMGISTTEMFKNQTKEERAAGKMPELSQDALDAMQGFRKAQQIDPSITAGMIRTAMANVKSLGITMSPDAITESLVNMGTKGIRAMNEAFRAYLMSVGATDVKKVNEVLATELNLFEPGSVKRGPKTKAFPKGAVLPGALPRTFKDAEGNVIDPGTRPGEFWRAAYEAEDGIKAAVQRRNAEQARLRTKTQGGSKAAIKAAGDAALALVPTEPEIAAYLNSQLAGANKSAIQGIIDFILGKNILLSQMGQADTAAGPKTVNELIEKNVAASADNFVTGFLQALGDVGQKIADKIDLNTILQNMTAKMAENPGITAAIATFGGLAAVGLAAAVSSLLVAPFTALSTAGAMLQQAAGALMRAAGMPVPPGTPGGPPGQQPGRGRGRLGSIGTGLAAGLAAGVLPAIAAMTAEELIRYLATTSDEQIQKDMDAAQNTKQIAVLERLLTAVEQEQRLQEGIDTPEQAAARAARAAKLRTDIARAKGETTPVSEAPGPVAAAIKEATVTPEQQQANATAAAKAAIAEAQKVQKAPTPAETAAATPANVTALQALIPQLTENANSIKLAVTGLTSAGTMFATVFTNGATAIGNSGQTAANTLTSAAPSIGAAIGNAAANAIRGAVANMSVNVNTNQTPAAPTGTSKP